MNTMNMPGFSAENALSGNNGTYWMQPLNARVNTGVTPQALGGGFGGGLGDITIGPEQCITRCRWVCTRYGCWPTDCYELCF